MGFETINLIIWAITGLLIGWLVAASIAGRWNIFLGMLIGLIGGMLGGYLLNAWRGNDWIGEVLATVTGALLLMLITRLIYRPNFTGVGVDGGAVRAASIQAAGPEVDTPAVQMPNMSPPNIRTPDVNMPDVHGPNVRTPDVNMPDVHGPNVRTPDVNMPDVNMPNVSAPNIRTAANAAGDTVDKTASSAKSALAAGTAAVGAAGIGAAAAASSTPPPSEPSTGSRGGMVQQTSYPDDLTKIRGIGKVYERRLHERNIFTWSQLARAKPVDLREWTDAVEAARAAEWPAQARLLAKQNNRIDAAYSGPIPDKLTEVLGIGESIERILYTKGVYTYAQLAKLSATQLAEIIPASKRSADTNFESWLVQAAKLQRGKCS